MRTSCSHLRAPSTSDRAHNVSADQRKVREHLGRCLALTRAFAGLSQAAVAQQLGIHRATVSLWETSDREPGAVDPLRLAEICGVGLDALCGRVGLPAPVSSMSRS